MTETETDDVRTASHENLILASRVEEAQVFGQDGDRIGNIEDL